MPTHPSLHFAKNVYYSTTISSGTTTGEIDTKGGTACAVYVPASVSSTTMKIYASTVSGGTFSAVYDGTSQYGTSAGDLTITIAADKWVIIPAIAVSGFNFIKLVFGSSETSKTYYVAYRNFE